MSDACFPAPAPVPAGISVVIEEARIRARIDALAAEAAPAMGGDFHVVGLLTGGFIFAADLVRAFARLGLYPTIDFANLKSYGDGRETTGHVRVDGSIPPVAGRRVLLVDDIADSGYTLDAARALMMREGAETVRLCALLDKPARRRVHTPLDHVGFEVPDHFVVGCGLDDGGLYRGLPFIGRVT